MDSLPLYADIIIWYASSVVCTSGSKQLLTSGVLPSARWLTLLQLCVASVLAWAILAAGLVREPSAKAGAEAYEKSRWALACTFVVGFGSLNASFSLIPASLAMTLRAAEPLFSVVLVVVLMGAVERPSGRLCLALLPIVGGTSMSSFGSAEFSLAGLLLVCVANTAFPLRTVIYKKLRAATGEGNFTVFAGVLWRAAAVVAAGNLVADVLHQRGSVLAGYGWVSALAQPGVALQLLVNGACYFTYLQWSFIVLSKVTIVTHAVANAMRRPVNIVCAVWFFDTNVSLLNGAGIVLACAGALLYSKVKADEAAARRATPVAASAQLELGDKGTGASRED